MRVALIALILTAVPLVASEEKLLTCELIPTISPRQGPAYMLWISNISKEDIEFCTRKRSTGNNPQIRWDRTDTWVTTSVQFETGIKFPAFYADVYGEDGKEQFIGDPLIRYAIQNPTGKEDSFCVLKPGQSLTCEYPVLPKKPQRAKFHFLTRREGTMTPIEAAWRIDQPPIDIWKESTGYSIPKADALRRKIYQVPGTISRQQASGFPSLSEERSIYDLKPWCAQNGLSSEEIDFAFYHLPTGMIIISTSEANHLKLKELHFEPH